MSDKDVMIRQLQQQNAELRRQNAELLIWVQQLRDKIAKLEKNSSNSSKPPSSDTIDSQPDKKTKKKRKIGGQTGHPKHSRKPFESSDIDRIILHKLPDDEVRRRGLIALEATK